MEICLCGISAFVVTCFKMVRISVVDVFRIFIENLKLEEVDTLLEKVNIPEAF